MKRRWLTFATIPLAAVLIAGCSTAGAPSTSGEGEASGDTLVVGTAPTLRPLEFVDESGEEAGIVIELIEAVAAELDLELSYERMSFDALIPAVQSGRIDMITQMGDLPERRSVITFIDFLQSGAALTVEAGNPHDVAGPEDLCGLEVAFAKGSAQQEVTDVANTGCVDSGQPAITMTPYPSGAEAVLALRSGQTDAAWTDVVNANYVMNQNEGEIEISYTDPGMGYGLGFPKADVEFREEFMSALMGLEADGTYDEILEEYGVHDLRLDEFTVNRGEGLDAPDE